MKISKKLFISNLTVTLVAMLVLATISCSIITKFIINDARKEIIKDNLILKKILTYDNPEGIRKKIPPSSSDAFIYRTHENGQVEFVATKHHVFKRYAINEKTIETITGQNQEEIYELLIGGKKFLAYNSRLNKIENNENVEYLIVTIVPITEIDMIIKKIIELLLLSVLIVSVISISINTYIGRKITKPIETLIKRAQSIGKKDFENKICIESKDEFESLSIAIEDMASKLKEIDLEQKKFYENISHELKTPLTVISGYAEGIKTDIIEDEDKALDLIMAKTKELKKQLEKIIYLSKLDTVEEYTNFSKQNINDILEKALMELDSVIIIKEIDVDYEPRDTYTAVVDEEKIRRMFINIISNCLKFARATLYIEIFEKDHQVCIRISDDGKGFSNELLENPFLGIKVGNKEGSGVGLSIIKKVVDMHDGKIILTNKNKGGAMYTIMLPMDKK